MSTKLYTQACAALWGPQFQQEAGRQLGFSARTAQRYATGETPVPPQHLVELARRLRAREQDIKQLRPRLAAAARSIVG